MAQASYNNLMSQISKLQAQAEQARKKEMQEVIQSIQKQMKAYNIDPKDLEIKIPTSRGRKPSSAQQNTKQNSKQTEAKFRHPETGATWSGRGRMPKWISEAVKQGRAKQEFAVS